MRRIVLFAMVIPILMILLTGCESGADFKVINRTSYPVYVTLEGENQVVIPGSDLIGQNYSQHVFKISTGTQNIFTGTVKEKRKVRILGETFSMLDDNIPVPAFVDSTEITVKAGKTLHAYLSPNRASIKIVNNSSVNITSAEIWRHNYISATPMGLMQNIASGTERFLRVDHATTSSVFYYYVKLYMENGTEYTYPSENAQDNVLYVDNQFLILLEDPI